MHGPPASGRTTAIAAALRSTAAPPRHAKRIAVAPGRCVEEALEEAAQLFRQIGSEALASVLAQRAHLAAKVTVLHDCLAHLPVILWLDDFDDFLDAGGGPRELLEGLRLLSTGQGKLLITTREAPGEEWRSRVELLEARWTDSPWLSTMRVAARDAVPIAPVPPTATGAEDGTALAARALAAQLPDLGPAAAAILEAAAVLPAEPSRQILREMLTSLGFPLAQGPARDEPALKELESLGLLNVAAETESGEPAEGPPIAVPSPVRRAMAARLRATSPAKWLGLHAALGACYLRRAEKSGEVWDLVASWRNLLAAGLYDDAYEVHKTFIQDLIQRGCVGIARHVLEECIATIDGPRRTVALGNLAILYKNTGDLARALELYGEAKVALQDSDQPANLARVLHQLGNTQYVLGDYAAALESYAESLEISTEIGDSSVAAATRIQMANVHYMLGNLEPALERYEEVLQEATVSRDSGLGAAIELQIGQIHLQAKRYLEAETHLASAAQHARSRGDLRSLVKVLEAQGLLARELRDYTTSREHYDAALRVARGLGDAAESAAILLLTGDMERARLQLAEALRCYFRARELLASGHPAASAESSTLRTTLDERHAGVASELGPESVARIERGLREKL